MKFTDLSSPEFFANPYTLYEEVRAAGPFTQIAPGAVLTGQYAVVEEVLHERRMGKDYMRSVRARYGDDGPNQPVFQAIARMLLMMNPPAHTRLRALLMEAFNARQIENLREIAANAANELVDGFASRERVDLIEDFALPLPIRIICGLLDVPLEEAAQLSRTTNRISAALDAAPLDGERLKAANDSIHVLQEYFAGLVERRRSKPGSDLISSLTTLEEEGESLTDEEIVSNVILLFAAGHETTSSMIGNALISLHRHPAQLAKLGRDLSLMPKAVAECMRYDGSVQMVTRAVTEDMEIAGVALPRDTVVFMLLGSANRDPARFADADTLDIERGDHGRIVTFGGGIHYCLGARLALLEIEIALSTLFTRMPDLQIANLGDLRWHPRNSIRGVESLIAA